MATSLHHAFDGRSWRIIKEFVGIYGIKMDYTKIAKLSRKKLSNIYFIHAKLSRKPFEESVKYVIKYDEYGKMHEIVGRGVRNMTAEEWISIILKRTAQGYKNKLFYEELSKALAPPKNNLCM